MAQKAAIKLFETKQVRSLWDSEQEKWYISVVDVIEVLTDAADVEQLFRLIHKKHSKKSNRIKEEMINFAAHIKQKTRLHHRHLLFERGSSRDCGAKVVKIF